MLRLAANAILWVLIAFAAVYLGDVVVWHVRAARGGGVGEVTVTRMVVATLKGNKEEFYPDGTEEVTCSQSLFPQTGAGACWWVTSHRTVFER